jgi:hypothetical protein
LFEKDNLDIFEDQHHARVADFFIFQDGFQEPIFGFPLSGRRGSFYRILCFFIPLFFRALALEASFERLSGARLFRQAFFLLFCLAVL